MGSGLSSSSGAPLKSALHRRERKSFSNLGKNMLGGRKRLSPGQALLHKFSDEMSRPPAVKEPCVVCCY